MDIYMIRAIRNKKAMTLPVYGKYHGFMKALFILPGPAKLSFGLGHPLLSGGFFLCLFHLLRDELYLQIGLFLFFFYFFYRR